MALTTRLPANQFPCDFALRMSQTTASVLPFDLVSRIIKEGDGGLNAHKKKFKSVLNFVEVMKYHPYEERRFCMIDSAPWDASEAESEDPPFPTLFPPVSWCTKASAELRDREWTEIELHRVDWWCPDGGSGEDWSKTGGYSTYYQPRFQAYLFH